LVDCEGLGKRSSFGLRLEVVPFLLLELKCDVTSAPSLSVVLVIVIGSNNL